MRKTSLLGLIQTLIMLIGRNNDLLESIISNSSITQNFVNHDEQSLSPTSEIFLNSKEACDLLKCSNVTLWKLRKADKIPFLKINTAVRFRRSDVINYITKAR